MFTHGQTVIIVQHGKSISCQQIILRCVKVFFVVFSPELLVVHMKPGLKGYFYMLVILISPYMVIISVCECGSFYLLKHTTKYP